jgi:hypothetical protein
MRIIRHNLWLCHDCHFAAAGVDETIVDQGQAKATEDGLIALGPDLVPDHDSETGAGCNEFSSYRCDCCASRLSGSRHRYAVLGPDAAPEPELSDAEFAQSKRGWDIAPCGGLLPRPPR